MPVSRPPFRIPRELSGFARIAQSLEDAVCITDPCGLIRWINPSFIHMCGYEVKELLNRKPGEILQGRDTCPFTVKKIHERLKAEEPVDADILNYRKDGTPYWVNMKITPVHRPNGKLAAFVSIEREISTYKSEQQKKEELIIELYTVLLQAPL